MGQAFFATSCAAVVALIAERCAAPQVCLLDGAVFGTEVNDPVGDGAHDRALAGVGRNFPDRTFKVLTSACVGEGSMTSP